MSKGGVRLVKRDEIPVDQSAEIAELQAQLQQAQETIAMLKSRQIAASKKSVSTPKPKPAITKKPNKK